MFMTKNAKQKQHEKLGKEKLVPFKEEFKFEKYFYRIASNIYWGVGFWTRHGSMGEEA
jgi:hypothetical protein